MMQTNARVLTDGPRNLTVQLTGSYDGDGPVETSVRKVDVSTLNPPCQSVKVVKANGDVGFGIVTLSWDGLSPKDFLVVSQQFEFDWCKNGGITNDLVSAGDDSATGDILLTTTAFEAGSSYSVKLEMVKKYGA